VTEVSWRIARMRAPMAVPPVSRVRTAPSSAAMLHAGVLKKFGLYGLIQIALPLLPAGLVHWSHPIAWLAVIGFLVPFVSLWLVTKA
jgi:NADH:ubiquinone oxidoreductase subunit 4 (subunit M)